MIGLMEKTEAIALLYEVIPHCEGVECIDAIAIQEDIEASEELAPTHGEHLKLAKSAVPKLDLWEAETK